MSSTATGAAASADAPDDRSTRARIRDAAIDVFAEHGWADTTARRVAAAADVSAGSVIHHFGSMDGLREACDHHVARTIRDAKVASIAAGTQMDVLAVVRDAPNATIGRYLARMLTDGPAAAELVDELVADAEDYLATGVEQGSIRPTDHPRARAAVVLLQSLGLLVLHTHVRRLLGVDLTDPDTAPEELAGYALPVLEVYAHGLLTPEFADHAQQAFIDAAATAAEEDDR